MSQMTVDAAVKALRSYFNPLRIMKGSAGDGDGTELVLVLKDFQAKSLRAYCEQAFSNLKIRDYNAEIVEYHSRGMKLKMVRMAGFSGPAESTPLNLFFTGDAEALPDGTPDPYLLSFYTVEQKQQFEQMKEKHGEGIQSVVAALKAAARGKGFKEYFLELLCILEFEENLKGSALSVAMKHLVRQETRVVKCPVTGSTVYVRGKAADGTPQTEDAVDALLEQLKTFEFVDTDGSGTVSIDELIKALEAQGETNVSERAAELLAKYDVGGDGMLQEDEYKNLFAEFFKNPKKK